MKVLEITEEDTDVYGDWITGDKEKAFIDGNYTHVSIEGALVLAEVVDFSDGTKGVCLGEDVE